MAKELGEETPYSRHTTPPARKSVPSAVKRLILELGLRFRPLAPGEQEPYQQRLALLAQDCSDIPPDKLEKAIERYVRIHGNNFLPRAAQLIEIAQSFGRQSSGSVNEHGQPQDWDGYCKWLNSRNFSQALGWHYYMKEDEEGRRGMEKIQLDWDPEEQRWVMPKPKPKAA